MSYQEYILGYGLAGDFGRFRAPQPICLTRGGRAVIRTDRGVEIGRVLRPSAPGHARFLPNTTVGQLLRAAEPDDEVRLEKMAVRANEVMEHGRQFIESLNLPLTLFDAEMLFDGEHVVLQYLRQETCDIRELVSRLSVKFDVHIALIDLTAPDAEPDHGCGGEGGCGSCGSEGGCGSSGSCGSEGGCGSCGESEPEEVQTYFAGLRDKMEQRRVPLL